LAQASVPTIALAPGLLSIRIGCPSLGPISCAAARRTTSVMLPAASGTMMRTGLFG
jgi:hypothetical protein